MFLGITYMPFKHVHTSDHPGYIPFGIWIEDKIREAQAANNTAEVEKIRAAVQAKEASVAGITVLEGGEATAVYSDPIPSVEEFNFYFDQWIAEFNVKIEVTEI